MQRTDLVFYICAAQVQDFFVVLEARKHDNIDHAGHYHAVDCGHTPVNRKAYDAPDNPGYNSGKCAEVMNRALSKAVVLFLNKEIVERQNTRHGRKLVK